MATVDEDLGQIERDIRQLKIEYDQFFGGGRKRPPTEIEWRLELLMKRYGERGGELKSAQRFRLNNLTQTYAKYKDIFRKKLKQKEEGTIQRHFGAAAKAIEAAGHFAINAGALKRRMLEFRACPVAHLRRCPPSVFRLPRVCRPPCHHRSRGFSLRGFAACPRVRRSPSGALPVRA